MCKTCAKCRTMYGDGGRWPGGVEPEPEYFEGPEESQEVKSLRTSTIMPTSAQTPVHLGVLPQYDHEGQ